MASVDSGGKRSSRHRQRIFVVWLERIEDMYNFPYDQMLPYTEEGTPNTHSPAGSMAPMIILYLHSFEPGLVRVHVDPLGVGGGRSGLPAPLQDGLCVSTHVLPSLLQQTVASVARRRLVDLEGAHQPHLRRRQAIAEFGKRFDARQGYADFLDQFLQ